MILALQIIYWNDFSYIFLDDAGQMKQMLIKLQSLINNGNHEELSTSLSELESLEDLQELYMVQLETEQTLLLNKIKELGQEMFNSSPSLSQRSSENWAVLLTTLSLLFLHFITLTFID